MGSTDLSPVNSFESNDSEMAIKISSEVMVAAVVFLFLVVMFVFFLYLYAKTYWGSSITARRRAQFIFAAGEAPISSRGLDASALRSLPVTVVKQGDFKDGLECSVCLCELSQGEEARLLPKCNHGFHLECIDMWFHSHSTCPLCRCPVGPEAAGSICEAPTSTAAGTADALTTSELPTNVLFWGNQDRINTGGSGHSERRLVISIPNRSVEGFPSPISPLPSSRLPVENMKSPAEEARSPGTPKFRSIRRLLSRGKRTGGSACSSPMGGDIEQGLVRCGAANGEGSSNVPKTPASS